MNAVAIAWAESRFTTDAWCLDCTGVTEDSRGLWQINVNAHPEYAPANNPLKLLQDSAYGAAAAFTISSQGTSWIPWSTFGRTAWENELPTARVAAAGFDPSVITATGDLVQPSSDFVNVRTEPGGTFVRKELSGRTGTIKAGPTVAPLTQNGITYYYVWWQIQWDDSLDPGWSAEDNLTGIGKSSRDSNPTSNPISVPVSAASDITLAGQSGDVTVISDKASLNAPVEAGLTLLAGQAVQVSAVSGTVDNRYWNLSNIPADGDPRFIVDSASAFGLSSVRGPVGALVGVFLTDARPANETPPSTMDFSTLTLRDSVSLAPAPRQVFYIGQGRTTDGSMKRLIIPSGATRLFLGVLDRAGDNSDDSGSFQVTLTLPNSPPVFGVIQDPTVDELTTLTLPVKATDPDVPGQTLTYSLDTSAPTGASIDPLKGTFKWTPTEDQGPGMYRMTVRVTDNGTPKLSTNHTFTVTVNEVNSPPTLSPISDQVIDELKTLTVTPFATDADIPANRLIFSLGAGAPPGVSINPSNGIVTWTPTEEQAPGNDRITVQMTDDGVPPLSASQSFNIVVNEVNSPPALTNIPIQTVNENGKLDYPISASDPDIPANTLTFSLEGEPLGMSIDPAKGHLTWSVGAVPITQTNKITVRVTDNGSPPLSDAKSFDLIVTASRLHLAPISDRTVNELSRLIVAPMLTNSSAAIQPLVFSLDPGALTNAVIDSNSGLFVWTPNEAQGPSTSVITIRVTDSGPAPGNTAVQSFTVTVNEVPQAPVLTAIERQTNAVGQPLVIKVVARDDDIPANTLSYNLEPGAPVRAAIDAKTGVFTWTPGEADSGKTNSVTVKVTDDGSPPLSAMATFEVVVVPIAPLRLSVGLLSSGDVELKLVNGSFSKTYFIETSLNLTTWDFLSFVSSGTNFRAVDQAAKGFKQRFYRAVSP